MVPILSTQGGIIMQNRQIRRVYLSLLAAAAVLCIAAGMVWFLRGQPSPAPARYLLKDSGGHVALYTADGTGPLAIYEDIYTHLLPESDVLALQQGVQRSYSMTEQEILNAVQDIFRDNFDDDTLEITRSTCADDIEDWDSLEQINLLTAIEKKFNIKFKLADVRGVTDVGDLLDLVARMV